jgi:hypothetical protein
MAQTRVVDRNFDMWYTNDVPKTKQKVLTIRRSSKAENSKPTQGDRSHRAVNDYTVVYNKEDTPTIETYL